MLELGRLQALRWTNATDFSIAVPDLDWMTIEDCFGVDYSSGVVWKVHTNRGRCNIAKVLKNIEAIDSHSAPRPANMSALRVIIFRTSDESVLYFLVALSGGGVLCRVL